MKIYLSPSGQIHNMYADNKHTEAEVCQEIADKVARYLTSEGVECLVAPPYNNDSEWMARCTDSDKMKADYHVCIHTNAGGGHGVRILCNPSRTSEKIMKTACEDIKKILPTGHQTGSVVGTSNLYEINAPRAKTIYYEVAFHDCKVESEWLINNTDLIARTIVKSLTGIDVTPMTRPVSVYRVQVGAFSVKANADRLATELKSKGYDAYVIHS